MSWIVSGQPPMKKITQARIDELRATIAHGHGWSVDRQRPVIQAGKMDQAI